MDIDSQKTATSITIKEQLEGAESRDFLEGLGGGGRDSYLSLLNQTALRFDYTPRLFHLHSWTGQFRADEIAPYYINPQVPCPYPFLQVITLQEEDSRSRQVFIKHLVPFTERFVPG